MLFDVTIFPIAFVFLDELQAHPENEILYGPLTPDNALTANIAELGILNPPLVSVRPDDVKVLIAGHRRVASAKELDRFFSQEQKDRRAIECRLLRGLTIEDEVAILIADNQYRKMPPLVRRKELHRLIAIGRENSIKSSLGIDIDNLAPDTPKSVKDVADRHGKRFRLGISEIRNISTLWGRIERETVETLKIAATDAFNAGKYTEARRILNAPYNKTSTNATYWQTLREKKPKIRGLLLKNGAPVTVDQLRSEISEKETEIEILQGKLAAAAQKMAEIDAIDARIRLENKILLTKLKTYEPNFVISAAELDEAREKHGF